MEGMAEIMKRLKERALQAQKQAELESQQGTSTQAGKTRYKCDECKDTGFIITKQKAENSGFYRDVGVPCSCREQNRIKSIMKSSKITANFQNLTFSNFKAEGRPPAVKEAEQTAKDYYKAFDEIKDDRNNSISLLGQPGAGKTHLLVALSNNFMQQKGKSVLYFPFIDGFDELRSNLDEAPRKIQRMKEVDILFIDDLFKGRNNITDYTLETMNQVVNYRYMNHKPLMVSSEKLFDDLVEIDDALASRISEMSAGYIVQIRGYAKRDINYRLRGIYG